MKKHVAVILVLVLLVCFSGSGICAVSAKASSYDNETTIFLSAGKKFVKSLFFTQGITLSDIERTSQNRTDIALIVAVMLFNNAGVKMDFFNSAVATSSGFVAINKTTKQLYVIFADSDKSIVFSCDASKKTEYYRCYSVDKKLSVYSMKSDGVITDYWPIDAVEWLVRGLSMNK